MLKRHWVTLICVRSFEYWVKCMFLLVLVCNMGFIMSMYGFFMRTFILFVFRPWFLFINLVACGCVFVYELFLDLLSTFLNDFKVSMLVGSMCLWERYKDLCVVLCILVYE